MPKLVIQRIQTHFAKKKKKKIDEKKHVDATQYSEGDLYKSAYKLNSDILYENIESLILYPDKTNAQKELISLLKIRFNQVDLEKNY